MIDTTNRPILGQILNGFSIWDSDNWDRLDQLLPDLVKEVRSDIPFMHNGFQTTLFHLFARDFGGDYNLLFSGKGELPNCNILDGHGCTPLYYACIGCNAKNVKVLLDHGASTDQSVENNPLVATCKRIAWDESLGVLKVLIKHGIDVRFEFFRDTIIPYSLHVLENLVSFALMQWYQSMDHTGPVRIENRGSLFIRELLNAGANVNFKPHYGGNLLHLACRKGDIESARVLIEHGCDYNLKDEKGELPLDKIEDPEIKKEFSSIINIVQIR